MKLLPLPRLELRGSEPHHAALRLAHAAIRGELLKTLERLRARKKPLPEGVPEAKFTCKPHSLARMLTWPRFSASEQSPEHTVEIPALLLKLEPHKQERLLKHLQELAKTRHAESRRQVECHPLSKLGADAWPAGKDTLRRERKVTRAQLTRALPPQRFGHVRRVEPHAHFLGRLGA